MILILLGASAFVGTEVEKSMEMWKMIAIVFLPIFTISTMIEQLMLLNSWHKPEWAVSPIEACNGGDWVDSQLFFTGVASLCGIWLSSTQLSFIPITGVAIFLLLDALRMRFRKEPLMLRLYKKPSSGGHQLARSAP